MPGRIITCGTIGACLFALTALGGRLASADDAVPPTALQVARLARDVDNAESIRAIKHLQISYAQYSQAGLWDEMASLFAEKGELIYGNDDVQGRSAIGAYFLKSFGGGHAGLLPGGLHTQMNLEPVINLSADGKSAKGRWHEFSMTGRYGVSAEWAGGIMENDYVKENGVWKIARLHYYPMLAGPYETGWRNVTDVLPIVTYHYTPAEAGTPIPAAANDVPNPDVTPKQSATLLLALDHRVDALNDEDKILNLQNAYGYYVDRKMWDDIADLFASDGVLEIADLGIYDGVKNIRRGLDRDGPSGLRHGELNDHIQFDTMVTISPDGTEARARGLELGMLGDVDHGNKAFWTFSVFENSYVKQGGIWRIRAMRIFPVVKADYYKGWGKSAIIDPMPAAKFAPDRHAPAADTMRGGSPIPVFLVPNPVTGAPPSTPTGTRTVGESEILKPGTSKADKAPFAPSVDSVILGMDSRINEAERKLKMSVGYDAVENISSAFGNYIDDSQWDKSSASFSRNGAREKYLVGFYIGPERIYKAEVAELGARAGAAARASGQLHLRTQPVIHVSPDGRSATLRTRLFHPFTSARIAGSFAEEIYPNDTAVLENGAWKLETVGIDEPYISSISYAEGWAHVVAPGKVAPGDISTTATDKLLHDVPPDVPLSIMPVRQKGFIPGQIIQWPDIKPMWFAYPNPVSGRLPPYYCPDEGVCEPSKN